MAAVQLCSSDDEVTRAQRRRDETALRSEWEVGVSSSSGVSGDTGDAGTDDATKMLRERIDLIETKEKDITEIKIMLRTMQAPLGIKFVSDSDEILTSAWIFVALNLLLGWYFLNSLVLEPAAKSAAGFL